MNISMKIVSVFLVFTVFMVSACATKYQYEGATTGGAVGAAAGAMLDRKNPWRGGVIGAALGAIFGATISDVAVRGREEVSRSNRPVEYRTEDGRGVYHADPVEYNARTKCRKVQERIWEDGRLVSDETKEVCEGQKTEGRY